MQGLVQAAHPPLVARCCRIDITVIDKVGRRHTLRGLEGQTLVELLEAHTDTLGEDGEMLALPCSPCPFPPIPV